MREKILSVKDLKVHYNAKIKKKGRPFSVNVAVKAVDGISFDLFKGETLGIVGESGCGKSTLGRAIVHLEKPLSGEVIYKNQNIFAYDKKQLFEYRTKVQMIFQDSYSTLDPKFTIGASLCEPLSIHKKGGAAEQKERALSLMRDVRLSESYYDRYPHEFSGGQRQRVGIARALTLDPEILICDEPVSALDVSIQAQILNMLQDIQSKYELTYIFISHDLSVVKHFCDRVGVFYLGHIVELADKNEIFSNMQHPYTKALMSAIPVPDPTHRRKKTILEGEIPSSMDPPAGCPFSTRCVTASERCLTDKPNLVDIGNGHYVACHKCISKATNDFISSDNF